MALEISAGKETADTQQLIKKVFIKSTDGWVIEGCYTDMLERALPFSNEMIFMNLPVETCILNAKKRPWESHKYGSKEAQDASLKMLIDWISQYSHRTVTFSERSHRYLFEAFQGKKTMYVSNERNT